MKRYIVSILLALVPLQVFAQASGAYLLPEEQGSAEYLNERTKELHSSLTYSMQCLKDSTRLLYKFTKETRGNFEKFKDVIVRTEGVIEEKNGLVYLQNSRSVITSESGTVVMTIEKQFDYPNKKIYWTSFQGEKKKLRTIVLPIKGHTADDVILSYFLKPYVAHRTDKKFKSFYLVTHEPKLYKFNVKDMGKEHITIGSKKKEAVKIKLTVDLGLVDEMVDKLVRPTYIWFEDFSPYHPLQYQGFETTPQHAYVILKMLSRECSTDPKIKKSSGKRTLAH